MHCDTYYLYTAQNGGGQAVRRFKDPPLLEFIIIRLVDIWVLNLSDRCLRRLFILLWFSKRKMDFQQIFIKKKKSLAKPAMSTYLDDCCLVTKKNQDYVSVTLKDFEQKIIPNNFLRNMKSTSNKYIYKNKLQAISHERTSFLKNRFNMNLR